MQLPQYLPLSDSSPGLEPEGPTHQLKLIPFEEQSHHSLKFLNNSIARAEAPERREEVGCCGS